MASNEDARSRRWTPPCPEGIPRRRVWVTPVDQLLYESWSITPVMSWSQPCCTAMLHRVSGFPRSAYGGFRAVIWGAWDQLTLASRPRSTPALAGSWLNE